MADITSKSFTLDSKSDIHMTFSAYLQATALITVTAKTVIQEGSVSSTKTFQPQVSFSSNQTIAYSEQFEAVSAGSTVITVQMFCNTGTSTINTGFCSMNLIVFPLNLTASDTAAVTRMVEIAGPTPTKNLQVTRLNCLSVDSSNNVYAAIKSISTSNGTDIWQIYKSVNYGVSWSDISLPVATSIYTTGLTDIHNASISFGNGILHVGHYAHISASLTSGELVCYNYWDGASWGYGNMLQISSTTTLNDNDPNTQVLVTSTGRCHYFTQKLATTKGVEHCYSDDYFSTKTVWVNPLANSNGGICVLLDNDDSTIHALYYNSSTYDVLYKKFVGTAWSTSVLTVTTATGSDIANLKAFTQDSSSNLWAVTKDSSPNPDVIYLHKLTSSGTAWTSVANWADNSLTYPNICMNKDDNPVIFYVNSGQVTYKVYDVDGSAFDTAVSLDKYNAGDLYVGNIHPVYKNGLHILYEAGTANSSAAAIYYYDSGF